MKYEEWLRVIKIVSDGAKQDGTTLSRDQCCRLREYFDANRRALCGEAPSSPSSASPEILDVKQDAEWSRTVDLIANYTHANALAVRRFLGAAKLCGFEVADMRNLAKPSPSSAGQEVRDAVRDALTKLATWARSDIGGDDEDRLSAAEIEYFRDREYPALSAGETPHV